MSNFLCTIHLYHYVTLSNEKDNMQYIKMHEYIITRDNCQLYTCVGIVLEKSVSSGKKPETYGLISSLIITAFQYFEIRKCLITVVLT